MISSTELRDPLSPQSPAPSYWVKAIILPSPTPALITSCPPLPPGCGSVAWCSWIIAGTCHCKEDVPYHLSVADFLPRSRDRRRKRWHPKALMLDSPCKEDVPYHLLVTDFLPRPRDRRRKWWHLKALMLDSPCKEDVPYHLLVTNFLSRPRDRCRKRRYPKAWVARPILLQLEFEFW
ncbi:hypothetical protein B0H14DRAFT_3139158 [Mycena olivaceomarginata]|nr:hypothetical protein B0H14DRAFT_3139158 [Mycena olivaceomarginata]